jgi:hypothetical protein
MTNWINWSGGECPIKSDRTVIEYKFSNGDTSINTGQSCRWDHIHDGYDIIAYRIIEDHEPMTRERITAQIEALQKQLDALPVVKRFWYGANGFWLYPKDWAKHYVDVETINGIPHIHGIAMKELDQA